MRYNFDNGVFPSTDFTSYLKGTSTATVSGGTLNLNCTVGTYQGSAIYTNTTILNSSKKMVLDFDFTTNNIFTGFGDNVNFSVSICNSTSAREPSYYGYRYSNAIMLDFGAVSGKISLKEFTTAGTVSTVVSQVSQIISLNTTYHVKITFDAISGLFELYFNNSSTAIISKTITSTTLTNIGTTPILEFFQVGYNVQTTVKIDNLFVNTIVKYLIQNGTDVYAIKSSFCNKVGQAPATKDNFLNYGADDLSKLTTSQTQNTALGIDNGTLGTGKYFSIPFNEDYQSINKIKT